jgi:tRNA-Thr(GGU) m(6)t(6)A37 methyltransferase TsaA
MEEITFRPIGIIHTPFPEPTGVPIQSIAGKGIEGKIEVFTEFADGLSDTEGFSHLILLFHLHRSWKKDLKVIPFMDDKYRGVFSTRSPNRPNAIGLSIVELVKREDNILYIRDLDIIDGTPLLDIKPYIPHSDIRETGKIGWLKNKISKMDDIKDDGRFV